ncbi:hypothetical protein BDV09DRAFT_177206 [Aspergillus tetrazonus]
MNTNVPDKSPLPAMPLGQSKSAPQPSSGYWPVTCPAATTGIGWTSKRTHPLNRLS